MLAIYVAVTTAESAAVSVSPTVNTAPSPAVVVPADNQAAAEEGDDGENDDDWVSTQSSVDNQAEDAADEVEDEEDDDSDDDLSSDFGLSLGGGPPGMIVPGLTIMGEQLATAMPPGMAQYVILTTSSTTQNPHGYRLNTPCGNPACDSSCERCPRMEINRFAVEHSLSMNYEKIRALKPDIAAEATLFHVMVVVRIPDTVQLLVMQRIRKFGRTVVCKFSQANPNVRVGSVVMFEESGNRKKVAKMLYPRGVEYIVWITPINAMKESFKLYRRVEGDNLSPADMYNDITPAGTGNDRFILPT
ncbi:hypothetical protein GQ42DRAFT_160965, partial [Ramicandelaber brevisporus]